MLDKASRYVKNLFFPLTIILVAGILAVVNYEAGTILTGWDSLHPEFNFPLAVKRAFFGVWREDQGLGALSIHSHMADLPRIALLWFSSLFIKVADIRYFYVFLSLIVGPLGIYFFLDSVLKEKLASFLGAIFYLLNLTTLQHFVVPFEMFLTQYALLPWLFLSFYKYLEEGGKKHAFIFFLLSIFSAPMAYAATLFYAYLGAILVFLAIYSLLSRNKLKMLKKGLVMLLIIFATNAYWILPNTYAVKNGTQVVRDSKINTLFSPEAFLRNKAYGSLGDIALQRSYLFSWRFYDFETGEYAYLLSDWRGHLSNNLVVYVGYLLTAVSMVGLIISLIKRNKLAISLFGVLLFSLFFLINNNPPTGEIYAFLSERFPVFSEGFRMPFSKFSIIYLFSLTFFFAYAYEYIFGFIKSNFAIFLVGVSTVALLTFFMKPAFDGRLIGSVVKTRIPNEYSQAFSYLDDREGRVAKLPIHTLFNWEFHDWGYEGSAWFSWFSMGNAQFDRDFDRFSRENESFYDQASFALYEKNLASFEAMLQKYNVGYLLLDDSVINAGGTNELLYKEELRQMFNTSEHIRLVQRYGFLEIYETDYSQNEPVLAPVSYDKIDTDLTYARIDPIYEDGDTYQIEAEGITYPFVNFDKRRAPDLTIGEGVIELRTEPLIFSSRKYLAKGELESEFFGETDVAVDEGKRLKATIPVVKTIEEDFSERRGFESAKNCEVKEIGKVYKKNDGEKIIYKGLEGGVSCDYFIYENLSYNQGYILRIKGENKEGRSLKLYLQNRKTKRMDLEKLLPEGEFNEYYFILPKDIEGEGYTLNLETRSFDDIASENIVEEIEFIPFPYEWLTDIKLVPQDYGLIQNEVAIQGLKKVNPARYELSTSSDNGGLIILDQAYENGWRAYVVENRPERILPWFGEKLRHTKVNNWANGWIVPEGQNNILIVFLPQYLEYFGFGVLISAFLCLILKQENEFDLRDK